LVLDGRSPSKTKNDQVFNFGGTGMTAQPNTSPDPHRDEPVRTLGAPLPQARAAMILLHGRGARAEDILTLAEPLALPGFAFLAPQAANHAWYPFPFLSSLDSNEPWLSSALKRVAALLAQLQDAGIPPERTLLLGFSQGACLALEYTARHARRYGGVVGLSGGLIGPPDQPRSDPGSLEGTPVFLGCSAKDPFISKEQVVRSAQHLRQLGGSVTQRLYPDHDHSANQDEIDFVRAMMQSVLPLA
jgi:phospholipase/carboxylesterase